MKTFGILTATLALVMTATAWQDPLPREGADCCFGFGHQTRLVVTSKGSGRFMSEGKWCLLDVDMDPQFPDDCSKATRSKPAGYCESTPGTETFPVVAC